MRVADCACTYTHNLLRLVNCVQETIDDRHIHISFSARNNRLCTNVRARNKYTFYNNEQDIIKDSRLKANFHS